MLFSTIKVRWIWKALFSVFAFFMVIPVFAQSTEPASANLETLLIVVLSFVLIVAVLILVIGLYLVNIIKMILLEDKKQKAEAEGKEFVPEEQTSWWNKMMSKASDAVPG
jgi:hypothetical protein